MGNRATRRTIQSLRRRILEHYEKIERERARPKADYGLIDHWEKEIKAFTIRVRRLEERLARRRRRGRSR